MTIVIPTGTAVGYFRVSGPGQAGERHVSLEVQENHYTEHCRGNQPVSKRTFIDIASGRKDDRAQYMDMLAYVVEHGIRHVVVLFLDRFGRNPGEILRRFWALEELGIKVHSINEDLEEELTLLLRAGIAGQDSKRTSERVRMALRKAAEQGKLTSRPPFGYVKVRDAEGERIEQVPREAAAVRLAFELATKHNLGYKRMADELNGLGYRTKSGALFAAQTVKLILLNPAMVGQSVFTGQGEKIITENVFPAILDTEEWHTLQQRLALRRDGHHRGRTDSSPYLLSGSLRCGHCGGAMTGASKGQNKYSYYVCGNRKMARDRCDHSGSHRKEALEEAILGHLGQYSDPELVRALLEEQGKKEDVNHEAELAIVSGRLVELERAFLNDMDRMDRGILTEPEYMIRQEVRREEQEGLQSRKSDLEARVVAQRDLESQTQAIPVKIGSFLEDFHAMDVRHAKAILQGIIKAAHVFNDGRIELEFRG